MIGGPHVWTSLATITQHLLNRWRRPTKLWHASEEKFEAFDPQRIGTNASKYGHGFYFCRTRQGALTAIHGAKYLYEVEVAALHAANFIAFDKPIEDQSDAVQAAAAALKMHDPLTRHESHLKASGNYLRQAAETAASALPGIYSRDILLQHGVTGFAVVDGRAESDRIVVVYDPAILRIKCRHDLAQADRGRA